MRRGTPKRHAEIFGDHTSGWREQEKVVARRLNAETVPGSGAGRRKGDVRRYEQSDYLIECKGTEKPGAKSIRIQGEWLSKITREARAIGCAPALQFEIRGHLDPGVDPMWVAIPLSEFQRIIDERANVSYIDRPVESEHEE